MAVFVAALVGAPTGILLSYPDFIFALLGLFFYNLFGLILGAILLRVAGKPSWVPPRTAWVGVAVVVATTWGTSLYWEYRASPAELADQAVHKIPRLPSGYESRASYESYVKERARAVIDEQYPPGGWIGYLRWMADSGRMPRGTFDGLEVSIGFGQRRFLWAFRVIASLALLTFGVSALIPRKRSKTAPMTPWMGDEVSSSRVPLLTSDNNL